MDRRGSTTGIRVWLVALDGPAADRLVAPDGSIDRSGPGGWLDPDERSAAAAKRRPEDRRRHLVSHVAQRIVLAAALGVDPAAIALDRAACPLCDGHHGRPVVAGHPDLHRSLARAGGHAAVALAPFPIGIDIEARPARVGADDLVAALHADERVALDALAPAERDLAALRTWTRKEALLKGWGTGLGVDPAEVLVGPGSGADQPVAPASVALGPMSATATDVAGVVGATRTVHHDGWVLTDVATAAPLVVAVAHQPDADEALGAIEVVGSIEVIETTLDDLLAGG